MSMKLLVVDDEAHILQVLLLKLRNAGYEVLTASDGEEGLDVARRDLPDLIITDFQMPYMTGPEMCKGLAADPATADLPVVMLTARGYALDDDDLSMCNIKEVLGKPFSPRSLVNLVDRLLKVNAASEGTPGRCDVA